MKKKQGRPTEAERAWAIKVLLDCLAPPGSETPTPEAHSADPWLSTAQAASHASVSQDTIRGWISSGQLKAGRRGRIVRIRRSDIDALLAEGGAAEEADNAEQTRPGSSSSSPQTSAILHSLERRRASR